MKRAVEIFKKREMYFGEVELNGISCTVGYIKHFKWRWFATQLNLFVFISDIQRELDIKTMDDFSTRCHEFAIKNSRGWKIQSGVAAIAMMASEHVHSDTIEYCEKLSKRHWQSFEIPVALTLQTKKRYRFRDFPNWGRVYKSFFSSTIDSILDDLFMP